MWAMQTVREVRALAPNSSPCTRGCRRVCLPRTTSWAGGCRSRSLRRWSRRARRRDGLRPPLPTVRRAVRGAAGSGGDLDGGGLGEGEAPGDGLGVGVCEPVGADLEGGLLFLAGLAAQGFQEGGIPVDGALLVGEAVLVEEVADGSGPGAGGLGVEEDG